jgi:hypothetical protein
MPILTKVEENIYKVTEFQKHTGITYMSHPFGKKALMCFNILIYNSYLNRDFHNKRNQSEIKEETLLTMLQLNGVNARTQAKKTIEQVMLNPIKYNLLAKDRKNKSSWDKMKIVFTDFDFISKPGYVIYRYNDSFLELMKKPNAYSKFNILTQYHFNHFGSIVLHSVCLDHLHTVKTQTTPWIPVDVYREMLGINENSINYSQQNGFRELRRNYIKKPIQEINEKSNIKIQKEEIKREGKKAVAVRFIGLKEHPYQPTLFDYKDITSIDEVAQMISGINNNNQTEEITNNKEEQLTKRDILNLQKRLINECNFSYYHAKKFLSSYDYNTIEDCIDSIVRKIKSGIKIKNVTEYAMAMIRNKSNEKNDILLKNKIEENHHEKILQQTKARPFMLNKDDFACLLKRSQKKNLSEEDIENAIFAVKENIDNGSIKTTPFQQLKMAISQKWQPKESVAKRKEKKKNYEIFYCKRRIEDLIKYKKQIDDDFDKYLFAKAKKMFMELSEEERNAQIIPFLEKWECKERQKRNFNLRFFNTLKDLQYNIQQDKLIKDLLEKKFGGKKNTLFKDFIKKKGIQYKKIDIDIKDLKEQILQLEIT